MRFFVFVALLALTGCACPPACLPYPTSTVTPFPSYSSAPFDGSVFDPIDWET